MTSRAAAVFLALGLAMGCSREQPGRGHATPIASASPDEAGLLAEIRARELARDGRAIDASLQASRDVHVRRAVARALSRIGDASVPARLSRSLLDEDSEVVAWSAYGLGVTCGGRESATVRALVARAASLGDPDARAEEPGPAIAPEEAIADALARCGSTAAEHTLRAWLGGPGARAESAALALGKLAGQRKHLDDTTVVALLDAASRTPSVRFAFAAASHLDGLPETVQARLLSVGEKALGAGGPDIPLVIRALGAAGPRAAPLLSAIAKDRGRPATLRALAAGALARLGSEGNEALYAVLDATVPASDALAEPRWPGPEYPFLAAALAALEPGAGPVDALVRLAELPLPGTVTAADRRRRISLRCGAAAALAGSATESERLTRCDPDEGGRTGGLAAIRVLGRGPLSGPRAERFHALARSPDPAVRRAALSLVPAHPELTPLVELLTQGLAAKEPGVVIQTARILATTPGRAAEPLPEVKSGDPPPDDRERRPPSPRVIEALSQALDSPRPPDTVEVLSALARAAGALRTLSLKPRVERLCGHANVSVRRGAEVALRNFGVATATCAGATPQKTSVPTPSPSSSASPGPGNPEVAFPLATRATTLTFVTDHGRLGVTLDPTHAPAATGRIAKLARAGFYDGMVIHRVVPGVAVQLGDRGGDGFGGADKAPLPCETSPVRFDPLSVGMALSGRDTGSSQIFITLVPEPQLLGDYSRIGTADADWATVAEGDVITRVEVRD